MEQKKAPLDLGLKMLENYKIVRHNEFRFISSEWSNKALHVFLLI